MEPLPLLTPGTPLAGAVPALLPPLTASLLRLLRSAPRGWEREEVHDLRVASRRLRVALRFLSPALDPDAGRRALRPLRRVTRALGPLRDHEEALACFSGLARETAGGRHALFARMARREEEALARARKRAGRRLATVTARVERRVAGLPPRDAPGAVTLGERGRELAGKALARALSHLPAALDPAADAERHLLRLACKRLRYLLELLLSAAPPAEGAVETLRAYQDSLGRMNDLGVFARRVRELPPPAPGRQRALATLARLRAEELERFLHLARRRPLAGAVAPVLEAL